MSLSPPAALPMGLRLANFFRPTELTTEFDRRMYAFLFILTFGGVVAFQAWTTLYTNYAVNVVGLNGAQNGIVQGMREVPGLLGIGVIALLWCVREQTLAVLATLTLGLGVMLTGFFPHYGGIVVCTMIMSFGFHYFETVNQSLTLQAYNTTVAPLVIGRLRGITAGGNIVAGLFILLSAQWLSFTQMFLVAGVLAIAAAAYALTRMPDMRHLPVQHKNMVLRSRYWLFYALSFLAGGRRQIFVVFSLYLLVEHFDYTITSITVLFLINNGINWFLNPFIGKAINTWGERRLLTIEYCTVLVIFLGYAWTDSHLLAGFLYIIDQIVYNFSLAVRTFFQKIAAPADIAPSMAVNVTINHIAAVVVPVFGGMLWLLDYRIPFYLGAGLAIVSLLLAQRIDAEILKNQRAARA
ncbi:MAG: MFS transporter [Desulfovibrionaceae bacterium]